jgi:branched-chain amino acid aminotransferase
VLSDIIFVYSTKDAIIYQNKRFRRVGLEFLVKIITFVKNDDMNYSISLTKTNNTQVSQVDFNHIPFGKHFSDHMFVADYDGEQWTNPRIEPFANFSIHPACMGLHYGQSIFEGMKAAKMQDGTPVLFRPEMHARRMNASAARMCMPAIPEELFLQAVEMLVKIDSAWIPPQEGSALYIRPIMFANDEFVGVRPSHKYRFFIITGPVGPYYAKPVRLLAETHYVRAVNGGTGEAKAAGNYAGAMLPTRLAQEKGFDQVMWLESPEFNIIQEVGTMNIFFVVDGKVLTPETDGAILKGITRDSLLTLFREAGYPVEVRRISMDELADAYHQGLLQDAFGAGTAAVVSHVSHIQYKDLLMELPPVEQRSISTWAKDHIDGMRSGRIADTHGWVHKI